jgi:hypothetical protein
MGKLVVFVVVSTLVACTPVGAPSTSVSQGSKAPPSDAGCDASSCNERQRDSASSTQVGSGPQSDAGAGPAQRAAAGKGAAPKRGDEPSMPDAGRAGAAAHGGKAGTAGGSEDASVPHPQEQPPVAGSEGASGAITTSLSDMLVRPAESECEYLELRAKNDAAGSPYKVPTGDVVQCFLIDAGFDAPTQALEFKAMVEHPELVGHMVLRTWGRSDVRGPLISCSEGNETYAMVAVWAPGMDDWYYPADMGVDLGRGLFSLEVRYVNTSSTEVDDSSGMRVCTTKKLRPRTASMSWLGNQVFVVPGSVSNYPVSGSCTPQNQTEPIHILRVAPYMNALGKRATMQIDRIDGSMDVLFDKPHAPLQNNSYDVPATVRVGDTVLSTCYYDNPSPSAVSVGVRNGNELCHFFVLAYPAYALVNDTINFEHNSCLGSP